MRSDCVLSREDHQTTWASESRDRCECLAELGAKVTSTRSASAPSWRSQPIHKPMMRLLGHQINDLRQDEKGAYLLVSRPIRLLTPRTTTHEGPSQWASLLSDAMKGNRLTNNTSSTYTRYTSLCLTLSSQFLRHGNSHSCWPVGMAALVAPGQALMRAG